MSDKIAVVTGASSGLGRGIARALGSRGFTVYVTGRTADQLEKAAEEISANGGQGIALPCDHRNDDEVKAVFDRIKADSGHLDILVNNAAAVYPAELSAPGEFWEKDLKLADMIDVGLRSHYVAAYYAAPLLIATGSGLIAHTSFYGARCYFHGPAYGAAKAGTDKMNFDMAVDLRPHGVASVSIWPGIILTDMLKHIPREHLPAEVVAALPTFETPEFTGLVIEHLWRSPERMALSGQAVIGAELGQRFGIKDIDGKQPFSLEKKFGKPTNDFLVPNV